jgi:hypothetical protein
MMGRNAIAAQSGVDLSQGLGCHLDAVGMGNVIIH